MNAFYGGSGRTNVRFHAIKLHADILRSAISVPPTPSGKAKCVFVALRYARWHRSAIFGELRQWLRGAGRTTVVWERSSGVRIALLGLNTAEISAIPRRSYRWCRTWPVCNPMPKLSA